MTETIKPFELDQTQNKTKDKLLALQGEIGKSSDGVLMRSLMDEGRLGLETDLNEMTLSPEQKKGFLDEYDKLASHELIKIGDVLDTTEHKALEEFFAKLMEKIEGLSEAMSEQQSTAKIDGFIGRIKKFGETFGSQSPFLASLANVKGSDIRDMIGFAAALLGLPQLFGVPAKKEGEMMAPSPAQPKQPETFEQKGVLKLFADATKTDDLGKNTLKYLTDKLSSFGTLQSTESIDPNKGKMILKDMKDPNKKHTYLVENNTLTGKLSLKEEGGKSKGVELAGANPGQLTAGLTELNKLEAA